MSAIAPQAVGGRGPIPFWAAAHEVIFDAFISDSWTPGASTVNILQGANSQVKPYPFLQKLWLKFVGASGSSGGTLSNDYPGSLLSLFRFQDPNGHAIIDTDGIGLYWLNKYGAREWIGDPVRLVNYSATAATPQASLYVPFQYSTLGIGSLPNMDASGPYRIFAVGGASVSPNTFQGVFATAPTTTSPTITVTVGLEAWSLPAPQSRVNGAPQVQAPPPLDRGVVLVNEYTKSQFSIQSGGGIQTFRLTRVGNILSQVYLVNRASTGQRQDWIGTNGIAASSTIQLAFDTNPIFQVDPQHLLEKMYRTRSGIYAATSTQATLAGSIDIGILVWDLNLPHRAATQTDAFDGGMDAMLQTAQSSSIELTINFRSGAGGNTLEIYTSDVTATTVTGQPYSFAYAGQLLAPVPPGQIRS